MKISDKLYVGFQRERYSKSDIPRVLGFAVPYGETDAERSRIETVDNWSDSSETARIIENKPIRGFKLTDVVSRYSTSNKLFRVADPRGFELEISASNMLYLISSSTIVKGEIIEECIWGVESNVYLINTSSDYYRGLENTKANSVSIHEEGKYYVSGENLISVFRFDGIRYHTYLDVSHAVVKSCNVDRYGYRQYVDEYDTIIGVNMAKKPSYIYTEFTVDADGYCSREKIHIRKSYYKNMCEYDGDKIQDYSLADIEIASMSGEDRKGLCNGLFGYDAFFKERGDAKTYDYTEICDEIKLHGCSSGSSRFDSAYSYRFSSAVMLAENAIQNIKVIDKR